MNKFEKRVEQITGKKDLFGEITTKKDAQKSVASSMFSEALKGGASIDEAYSMILDESNSKEITEYAKSNVSTKNFSRKRFFL
jgi:hypothetical protein